jgi:hypothetical protein
MNRLVLIPAIAALSACSSGIPEFLQPASTAPSVAPAPEVVQLTAEERFITAAEANGCVINPTTITAIMAQASLSQDDVVRIVSQLDAAGRATTDGDASVRLTGGNCV